VPDEDARAFGGSSVPSHPRIAQVACSARDADTPARAAM
jgi:hypothetical protein